MSTVAQLETVLTANTTQHDAAITASAGKLGVLKAEGAGAASGLTGAFSSMGQGAGGLLSSLGGLVPGIGAVTLGVGALAGGLIMATKAAMDEQIGIQRMDQALQNNIPGWTGNTTAIEANIAKMEQASAFSDGQLRDSLAALVSRTHDVAKAFDLQATAMDFARGKNIDLQTATQILGKVYDGNVSILSRYGVAVEKGATATQALAQVQQTFAGQSEAYSNTAAGGIDKLKNAFDDAMETVGSTVLPLVADLATKFSEILPKIMDVVGGIMDFLKPAFELIGTLLNAIGTGLDWLGQHLGLWSDTTKTKTGEASQAWHEHAGVVATAATNIANSGTLAGQGYGKNTVEGVNAYQPDLQGAVDGYLGTMDVQGPSGEVGFKVGSVYAVDGIVPGMSSTQVVVSQAAYNLVMAADQSGTAATVGASMGQAVGENFRRVVLSDCQQAIIDANAALRTGLNFSWPGATPFSAGSGGEPKLIPGLTVVPPPPDFSGETKRPPGFQGEFKSNIDLYNEAVKKIDDANRKALADAQKAVITPPGGGGGGGSGKGGGGSGTTSNQVDPIQTASKLVEMVGKAADILQKLGDFKKPSDEAMQSFVDALDFLTEKFKQVIFKWNGDTLALAGAFGEGIGKFMGGLSQAVTLLDKLRDFKKPSDENMQAFTDAVDFLSEKFKRVIFKWNGDTLTLAGQFGEGMGKFMGGLANAVTLLDKLRDFRKPSDENMQAFTDAVDFLSEKFKQVIFKWNGDTLKLAADFGESMGKFIGGIGAALDTLNKLRDFRKPSDDAMRSFADAVDFLSDAFRTTIFKWNADTEKLAASFGEGVGKLVSGIGAAIDPLTKLADFKKPSDEAMASFRDAVDYLADAFRTTIFKWNGDTEKLAADFGEGIGKLVSGLGQAIDPLIKLTTFKRPTQEAIDAFFGALSDFLYQFDRKAADFQSQAGQLAADLGKRIGELVGGIGAAIDPLVKLADFKHIDASTIESFFANLWDALQQLKIVVEGLPAGFLDQAATWGAKLSTAFGGIKSALDALSSLSGSAAGGGGADVAGPLGAVLGGMQALMGYINDTALGTIDALKTRAGELGSAFDTLATTIHDDVGKILADLARLPGGGGGTNPPPQLDIPHFAKGGVVTTPTVAMVGDGGPEAIIPLGQLNSQAALGGTTVIYNNAVIINGMGVDATPEEHSLLVSLGRHKRRREHGLSVPAGAGA